MKNVVLLTDKIYQGNVFILHLYLDYINAECEEIIKKDIKVIFAGSNQPT